jgi:hypothetical protein
LSAAFTCAASVRHHLAGSILTPKKKTFAAVVIVHGSDPVKKEKWNSLNVCQRRYCCIDI